MAQKEHLKTKSSNMMCNRAKTWNADPALYFLTLALSPHTHPNQTAHAMASGEDEMKEEGTDAATTDDELMTSVLMPVLSCVMSFSPDLNEGKINGAFAAVAPFLPRMKHFCVAWDQKTNNAPYRATSLGCTGRRPTAGTAATHATSGLLDS